MEQILKKNMCTMLKQETKSDLKQEIFMMLKAKKLSVDYQRKSWKPFKAS